MHNDRYAGWHSAFTQISGGAETLTPSFEHRVDMKNTRGSGKFPNGAPRPFNNDADLTSEFYFTNSDLEWTNPPADAMIDHSLKGPSVSEAPAGQTMGAIPQHLEPFWNFPTLNATPSANTQAPAQTQPNPYDATPHQSEYLNGLWEARQDVTPDGTAAGVDERAMGARPRTSTNRREYSAERTNSDVGYEKLRIKDIDTGRTVHSASEKRYRSNINDKLKALCNSVPTLRIVSMTARGQDTADEVRSLRGLTPAYKLNKATILSKATEYIRHLQKEYDKLCFENRAMRQEEECLSMLQDIGAADTTVKDLGPTMMLMP